MVLEGWESVNLWSPVKNLATINDLGVVDRDPLVGTAMRLELAIHRLQQSLITV